MRILWESFGTTVAPHATELITATGYADGYAYLEVPAAYKEGNAVVAAYDSSDKILWSWHIWLTNDPIAEITYANNAGVMMDRNLGALTAEANSVGTLGLYYQWGRKDPFLGAAAIGDPLFAVATRHLKVTLNTEATSTVDFAVANPHKFVLGNASGDWLATKDNSLWASSKTMYDPCPAGWRVPESGAWNGIPHYASEYGTRPGGAGLTRIRPPYSEPEACFYQGGWTDAYFNRNDFNNASYCHTTDQWSNEWSSGELLSIGINDRLNRSFWLDGDCLIPVRCMKDVPMSGGGNEGFTEDDEIEW